MEIAFSYTVAFAIQLGKMKKMHATEPPVSNKHHSKPWSSKTCVKRFILSLAVSMHAR